MEITRIDTAINEAIEPIVRAGRLAGVATLVWREGRVASQVCAGWRDIDARLPIERDTLFRIASMTKPITSTAALILMDEGRFALSDPISRWAPEFTHMRVLRSPLGPLDQTVPAERPITFDDLLTHRSGITYGAFWPGPLSQAYDEALGGDIDSHVAPDQWISRMASLPLIDQPGAMLHYGHSTDLLGLLIARIDDEPLGDVLQRRICRPLGMKDTGFVVPREKRSRRAEPNGFDAEGRLITLAAGPGGSFLAERPDDMTFVGGGAGLWSTVDDYLAFARMFIGQGTVDGVRLLKPEALARMTSNCLTPKQRESAEVAGLPLFAAGHGFGLGVAVVMEPERAEVLLCGGGVGTVTWGGGFGGWWQADPNDGSVLIFLSHNMVERDQFAKGIGFGVYEAIQNFYSVTAATRDPRSTHRA
jgi:CubicO group peptidase (beta-lactamase class C family)